MLTRSCGVRPFAALIHIYVPIPVSAALNHRSDIANLSAHLHRLPTPPLYLRRMRLSPGRGAGILWEIRLPFGRGWSSSKSPSTEAKVNYLVIRYLYFRSVRGDLQEGHGCSSRCQFLSFRARNRGFCALFAFETLIFGRFEHKIGVFVRFLPSGPPFSGFSSTKSRFLCAFWLRNPHFRAFRAQNRHFCAREEG